MDGLPAGCKYHLCICPQVIHLLLKPLKWERSTINEPLPDIVESTEAIIKLSPIIEVRLSLSCMSFNSKRAEGFSSRWIFARPTTRCFATYLEAMNFMHFLSLVQQLFRLLRNVFGFHDVLELIPMRSHEFRSLLRLLTTSATSKPGYFTKPSVCSVAF